MYAIFEDSGRQYKVSEGDTVLIDLHDLPEGQSEITFDKVMFVGGEQARIGTPYVSGASVTGKVVEELKMPKVVGVIFRRRKGLRKKFGHRQRMLKVSIGSIKA
ncbi:MAG: 50S ribosomal protein L21 [Phycisphaerae bacterium]